MKFQHAAPNDIHNRIDRRQRVGARQLIKGRFLRLQKDLWIFGHALRSRNTEKFSVLGKYFFYSRPAFFNTGSRKNLPVIFQFLFRQGGIHFQQQIGFRAAAAAKSFCFHICCRVICRADSDDSDTKPGDPVK